MGKWLSIGDQVREEGIDKPVMTILKHPERLSENGVQYLDKTMYVCTWLDKQAIKFGIFKIDDLRVVK